MSGGMQSRSEARLGNRIALAASMLTAVTFAIAVLTPPLSGPLCAAGCLDYPYSEAASRFPRDYWWMYPALGATALQAMLMACLHGRTRAELRGRTLIGLLFAAMGALILLGDYFVQLAVLQPSLLAGETEGLALLSQYNPHGVFIALEELGYLLLSLSFPWMAAAFPGKGGTARAARWTLHAGFVLSIAALAGITAAYGFRREYRYEIAVISIDWLAFILVAAFAAAEFRRDVRPAHA